MNRTRYAALLAACEARPRLRRGLLLVIRGLPWGMVLLYPPLVLRALAVWGAGAWPVLVFPAGTLLLVEGLRRLFPRPRPFERWGLPPLVPHRGGGAFPSRHAASAAVIWAVSTAVFPAAALPLALLVLAIAATRLVSGLHGPRDVLGGLLLGLAMGLSACLLLPPLG